MIKKWNIKNTYKGDNAVIETILNQRGITDIEHFLNPCEGDLADWNSLSNIHKALQVLNSHIERKSTIAIIVDSDFDGIASSTIMYRYLKHFADDIELLYHERAKAHGLGDFVLGELGEYNLIILPDGLSSNYDEYEQLADMGTDIILLDHHPQYQRTEYAITVNCTLNKYPNKYLSGGGVTWKFCKAYDETFGFDYADEYVDLAASSIISDVMSVGEDSMENRYICKLGFENMRNPAIKAIIGNYTFNSTAVAYSISNLANACIRMGEVKLISELFICDDKKLIKQYLEQAKEIKKTQDEIVNSEMENIINTQLKDIDLKKNKVLIVFVDAGGVAGLIANKLSSIYNRPIIALTNEDIEEDGETYNFGSCRSFGDFNIRDCINETKLGIAEGHKYAAGFKIKPENLEKFKMAMDEKLKSYKLNSLDIDVDLKLDVNEVNLPLVTKINSINQITGNGFDKISVAIENIKPIQKYILGSKHSCVNASDIQFLKWNDVELVRDVDSEDAVFDCIAELEPNKYKPPIKATIREYQMICTLPFEL